MEKYDHKSIELKWQKKWEENYLRAEDFSDRPKHYHLVEFPYPSGSGLHVGHCMGYSASDAYVRMKRMQEYNVLFPIGWDAFGLPTENYAIKTGKKPQEVTQENITIFRKQMKKMGFSFDWSREVDTTDPQYYKWTQWIFLQFYKHGIKDGKLIKIKDDDTTTPRLAYQSEIAINWCPSCKIGLANEEVINGKCERCETPTEKRMQKQWMLRITAYADRLIEDLKILDYEEKIKTQQINWIGRSEGTNIKFEIRSTKLENNSKSKYLKEEIEVFTTRADTLFGCTHITLAPEHPMLDNLKFKIQNLKEIEEYTNQTKKKSDLERTELQKEKTGVEIKGIKAINPINGEEISIWIADYVLSTYGTGAVMAVPAHDERDYEFAKKYNIEIKQVIIRNTETDKIPDPVGDDKHAFTDYGILINSGEFDGLESKEAIRKITEKLKLDGNGDFAINYKLRDWIFSRQHYWGEPIPIIFCKHCAKKMGNNQETRNNNQTLSNITLIDSEEFMLVPVPENDLPVILPDVEKYQPTNDGRSPLSAIDDWVNVKCPNCGGDAKRETDTMPNWAGSSWYFIAYTLNQNSKFKIQNNGNVFLEKRKELDYWMPIDLYNGGNEHTTLHLLYSRFWHKFLFDLGVVPNSEPYQKRINHGIILGTDGQKMSKSRGNVVNPDDIIERFGADCLRAYIMFIGPYDQESSWNTSSIQGIYRFLNKIYNNINKVDKSADSDELIIKLNQSILGITNDIEEFHFNTVVSKLMEFNNIIEKIGHISYKSFYIFLKLLYPVVPHLASELSEIIEKTYKPNDYYWPKADLSKITAKMIEIVIQVNGKLRDKLEVNYDISDKELEALALKSEKIINICAGKSIKKVIVVPRKLVSIVV